MFKIFEDFLENIVYKISVNRFEHGGVSNII